MTSSSVTKEALNIRRATIPGQIFSGVLVMKMEQASKYPGAHLVLFPGNVGDEDAILNVYTQLSPKTV